MRTVKAHFDGKNVVIPASATGLPPGEVFLVFTDRGDTVDAEWLSVQEAALAGVWDNEDDAAYDSM